MTATEVIDRVRDVGHAMQGKWGSGRLRLLVDDDLRGRFDRQHLSWLRAVWSRNVAEIEKHGAAMVRGYEALDAAAMKSGAEGLALPQAWPITLPDGTIGALCQTKIEADKVGESGQYQMVWTVAEIEQILRRFPELVLKSVGVKSEKPDWERGDPMPF
jgi:hypothetical protein